MTSLSLNPTGTVWFVFFSSSPERLMGDHFLPLEPPFLPGCWGPLLTLLLFLSTFTQVLQDSLLHKALKCWVFPTALALILAIRPLRHSWVASSRKTAWPHLHHRWMPVSSCVPSARGQGLGRPGHGMTETRKKTIMINSRYWHLHSTRLVPSVSHGWFHFAVYTNPMSSPTSHLTLSELK